MKVGITILNAGLAAFVCRSMAACSVDIGAAPSGECTAPKFRGAGMVSSEPFGRRGGMAPHLLQMVASGGLGWPQV